MTIYSESDNNKLLSKLENEFATIFAYNAIAQSLSKSILIAIQFYAELCTYSHFHGKVGIKSDINILTKNFIDNLKNLQQYEFQDKDKIVNLFNRVFDYASDIYNHAIHSPNEYILLKEDDFDAFCKNSEELIQLVNAFFAIIKGAIEDHK